MNRDYSKAVPPSKKETKTNNPYQIKVCKAGRKGCIHALINPRVIAEEIERILDKNGVGEDVLSRAGKKLLYHRKFKVAIAGCPNCCPQPQIKDFGINGQAIPVATSNPCIECMKCVKVCKEEGAIKVINAVPLFDYELCTLCGDCERVCPTSTIENRKVGLRAMAGGRLGRHPRLADVLIEMADEETVYQIFEDVVNRYLNGTLPFKKRKS